MPGTPGASEQRTTPYCSPQRVAPVSLARIQRTRCSFAPYHDVGMTAIKVAAFGRAVNVTLGLPFPRTSPDHGTALDIAGRGVADPSSMIQAILMCARIAQRARSL